MPEKTNVRICFIGSNLLPNEAIATPFRHSVFTFRHKLNLKLTCQVEKYFLKLFTNHILLAASNFKDRI